MENEKILIGGGVLLAAYLLFKKKDDASSSATSDADLAESLTDDLEDEIDLEADELEDLYDSTSGDIDFDDVGDLDDYFHEEIEERGTYLADRLTSIAAYGGSGGGGGGGNGNGKKNGKKNGNGDGDGEGEEGEEGPPGGGSPPPAREVGPVEMNPNWAGGYYRATPPSLRPLGWESTPITSGTPTVDPWSFGWMAQ